MSPQGIPVRRLGKDGPLVSALGFGASFPDSMESLRRPRSDGQSLIARTKRDAPSGTLQMAMGIARSLSESGSDGLERGATLVLRGQEDSMRRANQMWKIFLATKFGIKTGPDGSIRVENDPEYGKEACDRSLQRLGIECVDLYYCHRLNGQVPIEKVVEAMSELVEQGKVKNLGLSEVSSESLRRAHKVHPIAAVQVEYSPFTLDIESPEIALLDTCRELGIAIVAYSPLGRGVLTTRYKSPKDFEHGDWRHMSPRFDDKNFEMNLMLRDNLDAVARRKGCTLAQLVLAWLMAKSENVIPIPGTKRVEYLEENVGAMDVTLTKEETHAIDSHCARSKVMGDRYPEPMMAALLADTPALES